jgi:hypothetical protein
MAYHFEEALVAYSPILIHAQNLLRERLWVSSKNLNSVSAPVIR